MKDTYLISFKQCSDSLVILKVLKTRVCQYFNVLCPAICTIDNLLVSIVPIIHSYEEFSFV